VYLARLMRATAALIALGLAAAGVALAAGEPTGARAGAPTAAPAAAGQAPPTNALYDRYCLACHGAAGDGAGPAAPWLYPKPRDFGKALYRYRTTPSGRPPSDEDLARVIRDGLPGTSMPGFAGILSDAQVTELVAVVKGFAPRRFEKPAAAVKLPAPPADLAARATRGAELFEKVGCAQCHGAGLRGDGPAAAQLRDERGRPAPPHDLTARPLKRGGGAAGIYTTLVTGLDGANMPSFAGALPDDDLWALAAFVDGKRWQGTWPANAGAVDTRAAEPITRGFTVPPQGAPPASLPPAAASLSAQQCGRCHASRLREWRTSLHSRTASPGTMGQLVDAKAKMVDSCQRCHMPLAEQLPGAPGYDAALRGEGVTCAACHVRGWVRRGPPRAADAKLLADPSYPFVVDAAYERSDFCLPCHQLAPGDLVAGRPLLDTYREWLEGPYMRRGIQCQHCHMPEREHTWKGAHDPDTVRQGVKLSAGAARKGGGVEVRVTVENVGAGHFLPTTPTPAAFIEVTLLDGKGKELGRASKRIGRHIEYKGGWRQLEDTRIPPGETLAWSAAFPADAAKRATRVRVALRWRPDDYYEGFYRSLLAGKRSDASRKLLEEALARAQKSEFVVVERFISL
jgi:mono/diheme cytochrome c family protein